MSTDKTEQALRGKYGNVLGPFVVLMETELHTNARKGDRPGWLTMSREQGLLEIYWHTAKLSAAVKNNDAALIREHSADVANMAMMLLDVCGGLDLQPLTAAPPAQPDKFEPADEAIIRRALAYYSRASDAKPEDKNRAYALFQCLRMEPEAPPAQQQSEPLKGWKLNHVQFVRGTGTAEIGYLDPEDDRFSPIVTVDTGLYYQPDAAVPLAQAILDALAATPPSLQEPQEAVAEVTEGLTGPWRAVRWFIPTRMQHVGMKLYASPQRTDPQRSHYCPECERLAHELVAERERCAKLCESMGPVLCESYGEGAECIATADACAEAIRMA